MREYDYIIVGSGSAGGFLTLRLSEKPDISVLLLEAGSTDAHWTTRIPAGARYTYSGGSRNWCFETEPEPFANNRILFQPRGKVIGGSSSLNGMVFVRGHPQDYAEWVRAGADGWRYEDVLPHFKAIERYQNGADRYRGGSGPISVQKLTDNHPIEDAFIEAGMQAGHATPPDYNGADQEGFSTFDANIDAGWRSATARECIRPAMKRSNVTVMTEALVTKIEIENNRAVGVHYRRDDKNHSVRAAREVVMCAGAFQSPQLLMLSGIGPADHLIEHGIEVEVDLPGVGQNLQDHLECHLKFRCPHKGMTKNHLMARHRILLAGVQWYLRKTGPASTAHSRVGAFFRSDASVTHPDIQFHFWPYFLEGWSPPPDKDGYCFDIGPTKSESRGWIKLRSADPFAAPRIRLNALSQDKDFSDFRTGIKMAREIAAQKAFDFCRGSEVAPGPDIRTDADIDNYVRQYANSAYHPCGTARMGRDRMSVCDPQARVYGVEGLRVADASIMPRITNGNINAPCMMIGQTVAQMIVESSQ